MDNSTVQQYHRKVHRKHVRTLQAAFEHPPHANMKWADDEGIPPEKPYSGKFNLRLSPELHREVAIVAKRLDTSINAFVEKAIKDELRAVDI